jgi:uncharacterized ion transporter superfamily protein YfcC
VVFTVRVKEPHSAAERRWNLVQDALTLVVFVAPVVLKLTGVITWSWWWVTLSPLWLSIALQALLVTGLATVFRRRLRAWALSDDTAPPP